MPRRSKPYRRSAMPKKPSTVYGKIWRIVDGAVADAFAAHPDYLTPKGARTARLSIVKRVTGSLSSFAGHSAKGRSP